MASSLSYFFVVISLFALPANAHDSADAPLSADASLSANATASPSANAPLSTSFYAKTCPKLEDIIRASMTKVIEKEKRMGASLLRLFFHDCFIGGCDASILLDDTDTLKGEKHAGPNKDSARGFEVIDDLKTEVEAACKATVSCADIFALATRDGVVLLGGPSWAVPLGRKDSTTASEADNKLPGPDSNLSTLISMFRDKGFTAQEMTTLSGAHTIGMASCFFFRAHIHNEDNIDPAFAEERKTDCPPTGGNPNLAPLDSTSDVFDNQYYIDLTKKRGLFHSDQELFNGGSQDGLVQTYSNNPAAFKRDFAKAMIKLGNLLPPAEAATEIRLDCRAVNKA